jgi:glycosyltransferase involved in cell wall biosynthesis
MPVYNGEKYLRGATDSILNQTFTDFEFIIINDCSTDATPEIIDSYGDPRIVRLSNETNLGHTASINRALRISKGEFIARMDADDVSVADRFQKQVQFLDAHGEVAVVASHVRVIRDDIVTDDIWRPSSVSGVLAWEMSWKCPILHPSVMMRRTDVEQVGRYDEGLRCADDHRLWIQMFTSGKVIAVLPEPLHHYRLWSEQIGVKQQARQLREIVESAHSYSEWLLGCTVDIELVEGMINLYRGEAVRREEDIRSYLSLARQVERRCREVYSNGAREIRNRMSDALIFGAASGLDEGRCQQARSSILTALSRNPFRAARPWTLKLLLQTFIC